MTRLFRTFAKSAGRGALKHVKSDELAQNHEGFDGEADTSQNNHPIARMEPDIKENGSAPVHEQSNNVVSHVVSDENGDGGSTLDNTKFPHFTALRTKASRDKSPAQSGTMTLTPPHDSSVPLTASSGKVGKLLVHIHRNKSRGFLHDKLIVIGVLSHQTWVSGEVLHFDVNINNTSDKSIKKIEVSFVRTISAASDGIVSGQIARSRPINTLIKPLATWSWKKGCEGWNGVAPQMQTAKTWNPIVPAGQATTNERGIEASYSLVITVPCLVGKATTSSVPIKVIAPNSLGRLRLEQRLRHSSRPRQLSSTAEFSNGRIEIEQDEGHEFEKAHPNSVEQGTRKSQGSSCYSIDPKATEEGSYSSPLEQTGQGEDSKDSGPRGAFISSSQIPKASDELLNEMLSNLSRSAKKANRKKRIIVKPIHSKQANETPFINTKFSQIPRSQSQRASILKPLSIIGAHTRPRSTEDARQQTMQSTLAPSKEPTVRASFDDFLRLEAQQKWRDLADSAVEDVSLSAQSNILPLEPTLPLLFSCDSHVGSKNIGCLSSSSSEESGDDKSSAVSESLTRSCSRSMLNADDLERFVRERRSFQAARRESANPFFKGSAGKERLRNVKYTVYQSLKERHEEKRRLEEILASQPYFVRRQHQQQQQQQHRRHMSGGSSLYKYHHPESDFLQPIGSIASDQRRKRGRSENVGSNVDNTHYLANRRKGIDVDETTRDVSDGFSATGRRYSSRYGRPEIWRYAGQRTLF